MLVGDYEFGELATDLELLGRLAEVAAAGQTPFLAGAAPKLFGVDRFADLPRHALVAATFDDAEHASWRAFRERPESRYVTLAMPRVLLREPFAPTAELDYEELASASRPESYLWGNAAWVLAAHVNRAMARAGWGAAIRGPDGGGRTDDLPAVPVRTAAGAPAVVGPTDATLDDLQEHAVAAAGIAPLAGDARGTGATFFSVPTCRRPEPSEQFAMAAGARMWAQLPYVLASSRVAQHLMAMVRDDSALTRATEAATVLNRWLARLVEQPDPDRPLAEGRLELRPLAGEPGRYAAVVYLNPRFQLEPLPAAMPLPVILPYL
jgi:type VI secretion system protein ImpC